MQVEGETDTLFNFPVSPLNLVEVGIQDGCSELCSFLPNSIEADICTLYCEIKGIDEVRRLGEAPDDVWDDVPQKMVCFLCCTDSEWCGF